VDLVREVARKGLRAIGAVVAAFAAAGPACAAPIATVSATIVKPVVLTWVQNLDLGTIILPAGTFSNSIVSLSRNGVLTCAANLTCTGTTSVAKYDVAGSQGQVVTVNAPNVTMVNQSDTTKTLILTVDNPGTVTIANSGQPGTKFSLGGSINLNSTTVGGVYTGTFNVTVNY
jgi:hypothetical protein